MKTFVGLDRREEWTRLLRGKRIGLITNYSGVDACWRSNVELFLGEGLHLVKLFTPEHGLFGALAGEEVSDTEHEEYHIPVISLYGDRLHPDKEDFEGIDVLVYDIMDVGLRYYTYIYTMTYCMETAASCGLPFVVLDRPNPLGGRIVSGGVMNSRYASFIGDYGLPVRYGLTPGEMGYYYLRWKKIDLDYQVVPLGNYTRDTYFPDTGCLWNIPSPALADYAATVCYAGGCFVGATSLSEGRGSSRPFQMYGAPFVRMGEFCKELERELETLLEHQPIDEEASRNLTRQIAAAQYATIPDEEYETLRLRRVLSQAEPMEELDAALLKNTVSHIQLTYGGIAHIQMKNGQLIERR